MALKEGKEYTILNKEQLKVIFGNLLDTHINGEEEFYEKFAGKKLTATHNYAVFPPVELGGNHLSHFNHFDCLEYILRVSSIETPSNEIEYYHNGDPYFKQVTINIASDMKEKIKSLA